LAQKTYTRRRLGGIYFSLLIEYEAVFCAAVRRNGDDKTWCIPVASGKVPCPAVGEKMKVVAVTF